MKTKYPYIILLLLAVSACSPKTNPSTSADNFENTISKYKKHDGFFNFYWDEKTGKTFLEVSNLGEEFLYVNYLAAGVGSNDLGLDRGQIGNSRIVRFERSGPKVLLIQPNYAFRAVSDNPEEVRSVNEAFVQSVLWGFKVEKEQNGKLLIDITDFLLSDSHDMVELLKKNKEGKYKLDASRSAIYLPMTKNFKDNSEFEATLTFTGTPSGPYIPSVTPTAQSITVRTHHSFVRLPDDGYKPRQYDPRSGFYAETFQDYATPIGESLVKRMIYRHRLEKKDSTAELSEPVKPIIYYVDKGAPEPVKSALIEGASWWNEAFEAAGFKNAFQVKVLPDSADPLDINYNVIQWVHRSTRGWSYGSWIADPRTGEILKGHVSLGSLRIRQDFLIATGLLQPYEEGEEPSEEMLEMALARLRQLAAHEVGHTLGLFHNFSASVNDRASVMDYPHPLIELDENGKIDLSNAYDTGIGEWDKYAIRYGYTDFGGLDNEEPKLEAIIDEWIDQGLNFITDYDARPTGGAHPLAHLWDNGKNAAEELNRLSKVRSVVLNQFSEKAIKLGEPISSIEEVLVPMYFLHRYQVEAASKLVGGQNYTYKVRGDKLDLPSSVSGTDQQMAVEALIKTLSPEFLRIPDKLLKLLSPKVPGYPRTRESFDSRTSVTFDPIATAETSAEMTLKLLFHPQRMERLTQQHLREQVLPGCDWVIGAIVNSTWNQPYADNLDKEIKMVVEKRILYHLMNLSINENATEMTKAQARASLDGLIQMIRKKQSKTADTLVRAHYAHTLSQYERFLKDPEKFEIPDSPTPPDGSPIGMECMSTNQ